MSLEQLLQEIRQRRLWLTFNHRGHLVLFANGAHVPLTIRQAIRSHSQSLQTLVQNGDYRVCENAQLHRQHWRYAGQQRYVCEACSRWQEVS